MTEYFDSLDQEQVEALHRITREGLQPQVKRLPMRQRLIGEMLLSELAQRRT